MRFNCPEKPDTKSVAGLKKGWAWYAWYPVRLDTGGCVWFEKVWVRYPNAWLFYEDYWPVSGSPEYSELPAKSA